MFEHILRGHSIEETLGIYRHHFEQSEASHDNETNDNIELF